MKLSNSFEKSNFKKILNNYQFTNEDAKQLSKISSLAKQNTQTLLDGFYDFIFKFDHAKMFLHNKEILARHKKGISLWYENLFCGNYDENYFDKLNIISEIHVKIGLPAHYVNAAFSFVRRFIRDILIANNKLEALSSLDKIIDINLDILTIAYQEEEQSKLFDDVLLLKKALENDGVLPYFQAILNTKTLEIEKYESLMRLKKNQDEVLSVFSYLQTSKKIKLYEKMMFIMFEKSLATFHKQNFDFSINLSYEDIENEQFRHHIYETIKRKHHQGKSLIFEILESDFIEDFTIVEQFAKTLRKYSCKIAIDDFGSGYSNMENILKLKPDIIKIDGSLIKNINTSNESKTIVKNIVNMAKELKAQTVAEYVHSKEIFEIVKSLNVDFLQGFYFHEPEILA